MKSLTISSLLLFTLLTIGCASNGARHNHHAEAIKQEDREMRCVKKHGIGSNLPPRSCFRKDNEDKGE